MEVSNLINYYKDCYQADSRTLSISNFFSTKFENKLFVEDKDQLLNGNLPYAPVMDEYAKKVLKNLTLYRREKAFYCAAFFVIASSSDSFPGNSKICAPVFLYPAKIVTENEYSYVKIDFSKRIVNINFLNSIRKEDEDDLYDTIINTFRPEMNDFGNIGKLKSLLEVKLNNVSAEELLFYPDLYGEKKVKRLLQLAQLNKLKHFTILPNNSIWSFTAFVLYPGNYQ